MTKHHSILIIDDEESDHIIATYAVKVVSQDIQIHYAYDGEEALDLLKKLDKAPDIILLDLNMPGMDGKDFLENYNENAYPETKVVILSTSDEDSDRDACLAFPFVKDYLQKPIHEQDIMALLHMG